MGARATFVSDTRAVRNFEYNQSNRKLSMRLVRNVVMPIAFGIAITPAIKRRANYSQFDWVTRPEIETSQQERPL